MMQSGVPLNPWVYEMESSGWRCVCVCVCWPVWKSNANKPSPLWYLNCFLFDNPIIVSRAVSIALAISSWTNHSRNLQHFRFDSAIFWQFKAISGGLTRTRIDFVFSLIMLIPRKSAFSSPLRLIAPLGRGLNCADSLSVSGHTLPTTHIQTLPHPGHSHTHIHTLAVGPTCVSHCIFGFSFAILSSQNSHRAFPLTIWINCPKMTNSSASIPIESSVMLKHCEIR